MARAALTLQFGRMGNSQSSSTSPGHRQKSLPGLRRPLGSTTTYIRRRPDTVPNKGEGKWGMIADVERVRESSPLYGEDCFGEGWIKASWRKGECREEILLVANASGLAYDDARIVTLRLLNHFNWLPWLHERAEKLKIIVGRERRLSLSVVRKPPKAVISGLPASESMEDVTGRDHRHHQGGSDDEGSCASACSARRRSKSDFNSYVRGLCALCQQGTFEQVFDFLLRVYSTAREEQVISRAELAVILEHHVIYDDIEGPRAGRERVYRWLKRQFIELADLASTKCVRNASESGAAASLADAAKGHSALAHTPSKQSFDRVGIPSTGWDSARSLIRQGPHGLEDALTIDLPRLSKDLWAADLADGQRTMLDTAITRDCGQ